VSTAVLPRMNAFPGPRSVMIVDNGSAHNRDVSQVSPLVTLSLQRFFGLIDTLLYFRTCNFSPILTASKLSCSLLTRPTITLLRKHFTRLRCLYVDIRRRRKYLRKILKVSCGGHSNILWKIKMRALTSGTLKS
jgi:hypothetical protein